MNPINVQAAPSDGVHFDVVSGQGIGQPGATRLQSTDGSGGSVAMRLMQSGFDVGVLRTNAVLRRDEWKLFDDQLVGIARERLVGVGELIRRGLVYNLRNALGVMSLEWETSSDLESAEITMGGLQGATRDRLEFGTAAMPIPIIHKDFQLNIRHLTAARRNGNPIDTTQANVAARKVSEKIENILFNGVTGLAATNGTIYGLLNHPNRNTGSVAASWATSATGDQILSDTLAMITKAVADNMFGPYVLFVPTAVGVRLGNDFKAASDKSIMSRLLENPLISSIIPTSQLTGTNILLVQLTRDVVEMVNGFGPTNVQWQELGGFIFNYKVMAIMVPRVRADSLSQSGIVHYS